MADLQRLQRQIEDLIRAAGTRVLAAHNAPVHQKEGHNNFVTDTDVAVQEFLRAELSRLLPEGAFFAEEQENAALTDDYTWVVDPIDGTLNFMHDRRCSAISIALLHKKEPVVGVICNPYADEVYSARKGAGAFCNGKPIHVSDAPFEHALIDMGTSPYNAELVEATAWCFSQFMRQGGDIRRCGSAALDFCSVACGRGDVFFELILSPWDYAAGALIVCEAGGVFLMPFENQPDFGKRTGTLCANPHCIAQAEAILREAGAMIR